MMPNAYLLIRRRRDAELQRAAARHTEFRHIRDYSNPFDVPAVAFVKLYRLSKETAHFLIDSLHDDLHSRRQHGIPVHIKVLAALHFFGHGGYQATVGNGMHLGLSQPSVSKCLREVVDAIFHVLLDTTIVFPQTEEQISANRRSFQRMLGFPGVIGLIDCTHISIIRPKDTADAPARLFFNRKGFYSLNCQFVCNAAKEVIHVNAMFPGSTHDSAIWQMSNVNEFLQGRYIEGMTGEWLLGDSGYPLLPWLITPYAEVNDNTPEARFNIAHTGTRVGIENCFGLIKTRFRCLHKHRTLHYDPTKASRIVTAVAVLHNLTLKRNDPMPEELEMVNEERHIREIVEDMPFLNAARRTRDGIARRHFA